MSKKNFSVGCQGAESFLFFNFLKNFVWINLVLDFKLKFSGKKRIYKYIENFNPLKSKTEESQEIIFHLSFSKGQILFNSKEKVK
jgi:hypothetical protein